jgi:hypothetical protein
MTKIMLKYGRNGRGRLRKDYLTRPKQVYQVYNYYSNKMHTFLLLKSQDITIRNFVLYFCPYMFQPGWVIFRGLNASAWLKLLLITVY